MIITKPELIKLNEKSFIESLIENLDWEILTKLIKNKLNITDIACKEGDIIVLNDKVAYKLNLELKLDVDVIFDRMGEFLSEGFNLDELNGESEDNIEALSSDELIDEEPSLDDDVIIGESVLEEEIILEGESESIDIDDLLEKDL
ncbi:MAG: hypothetical protein GY714_07165 [Desulfobacterales bacterium]|nr:hypothetical protein [Desulfobacterales bacterium]MCP4159000.1 hypothetical protein [Deltaproteobacteria bacterium]